MSTGPTTHNTAQIAEHVGGDLIGPDDTAISGISDFNHAQHGHLTLIGDQKYADRWPTCHASAALILDSLNCPSTNGKSLIRVKDADLAFSKALSLYAPPNVQPDQGVHPNAVVHPTATLGKHTRIGAHAYIGPGVTLGEGCTIHPHATVLDNTTLGKDCVLWPGVVVRERCTIGDRCIIHPNAAIGADGFGYRPEMTEQGPRLVKTPQIGTVTIGHDVEIGANTCIDRAKCNATIIGDGCKIDNLVQIGHNCVLGKMVIVSGCTGIGGSTTIGDGTMIGGHVAITDHAEVGPGCQIAGGAQVARNLPAGGTYAGTPARPIRETMREVTALRKLPDLLKQHRRR